MKIKQSQQVEREVTVHIKCDVCNKIHDGGDTPDNWHTISNHHNHWGNDSRDSYEYHDVCSIECYKTKMKEIVADYETYTNAKVDDFEIQFARLLVSTF